MSRKIIGNLIINSSGKTLPLSKITSVKIQKEIINIEKLDDGTYRLVYTDSLIPELKEFTGIEFKRNN